MRLWHKDLISVLPRQQLLSQWRECCCMARNIAVMGTPSHLLVNKILDYPIIYFYSYTKLVRDEMIRRGYKVNEELFLKHYRAFALRRYRDVGNAFVEVPSEHIFKDWHDERYLKQCFYNLQEKYDCGGISQAEWLKIDNYFKSKEITL